MKNKITLLQFATRKEGSEGNGDAFTQDDINSAVAAAVAKERDELNAKLGGKNKELLADLKKLKEQNAKYSGIDPDKFKSMMNAFENDQDLKDIADGKVNDVINRRVERERADFSSQLDGVAKERDELRDSYSAAQNKITDLMINNSVVSEFVKQKGVESAIPDVVLRAKTLFKVEGDEVIARDSSGEIITGSKGPLTIDEWITGLKESAKHLFPSSSGAGGAGGGSDGSSSIDGLKNAARSGNMSNYRKLRAAQK